MFSVAKLCKTTAVRLVSFSSTALLKRPQISISHQLRRSALSHGNGRQFMYSRLFSEVGIISTRLKSSAITRWCYSFNRIWSIDGNMETVG